MAKGDLKADVIAAITTNGVVGNQINTAMFSPTSREGLMSWEVAKSVDGSEYFVIFYTNFAPKYGVSLSMRDTIAGDAKFTMTYNMGQAEALQANDLLALLLSLVDRMYNNVP